MSVIASLGKQKWWALLAINIIPIVGIIFFNWSVFDLFWMFWMETYIISCFDAVRVLTCQEGRSHKGVVKLNYFPAVRFLAIRTAIFFFYATFIITFVGILPDNNNTIDVVRTVAMQNWFFVFAVFYMILHQAISITRDYFNSGEYLRANVKDFPLFFDARQLFMHIAIVIGAALCLVVFKGPYGTIMMGIFFCILKSFFEYMTFFKRKTV